MWNRYHRVPRTSNPLTSRKRDINNQYERNRFGNGVQLFLEMPERSFTGKYHLHSTLVTCPNDPRVLHGPARLDDGGNPFLCQRLHIVQFRKEPVRSQHAASKAVAKLV